MSVLESNVLAGAIKSLDPEHHMSPQGHCGACFCKDDGTRSRVTKERLRCESTDSAAPKYSRPRLAGSLAMLVPVPSFESLSRIPTDTKND